MITKLRTLCLYVELQLDSHVLMILICLKIVWQLTSRDRTTWFALLY